MKKINVEQFFNLPNEKQLKYVLILENLKPNNYFAGKKFNENKITYKEVRQLFKLISNEKNLKDIFIIFFKVTDQEFYNADVVVFFSAKNYILKFLTEIKEKEKKLLQSNDIDAFSWQQAGGKRLDSFNDLMPLVQIGEIYKIYPFELQEKPYFEILVLLTLHKTKNEIQNEYSKLKNK